MYNVINYEKTYLCQYREAIRNCEILDGQEMIMELDILIHDWDNPVSLS